MILEYLFFLSGAGLAVLIFTKVREMKTRRQPALLRLISRGDERLAEYSHRFAHFYADGKEDARFFLEKQLPLYARRFWNKSELFVAEHTRRVADYIQDSKYFKKNGDISDFFKSIAEGEKESSEDDNSQNSESELE